MEYHRDRAELFDFAELATKYHLKYDEAWFRPIVAELRSLLIIADTKDGISAALRPEGYGAALEQLLARAGASELQIDWRKEEILSDASDLEWFPSPDGWKYIQFAKESAPASGAQSSPVSQVKVDLAVLYKLHQHAESGGGPITPGDLLRLFDVHIPARRIELALEGLEAKRDVERHNHEFTIDGGFWKISREGMAKVDRALRVSTSFIGRLHANSDSWLESDEAKKAILKKLDPERVSSPATAKLGEIPPAASVRSIGHRGIDWTKWGTILAAVGIAVSVLLWVLS
jgi:hypothetical protein